MRIIYHPSPRSVYPSPWQIGNRILIVLIALSVGTIFGARKMEERAVQRTARAVRGYIQADRVSQQWQQHRAARELRNRQEAETFMDQLEKPIK